MGDATRCRTILPLPQAGEAGEPSSPIEEEKHAVNRCHYV